MGKLSIIKDRLAAAEEVNVGLRDRCFELEAASAGILAAYQRSLREQEARLSTYAVEHRRMMRDFSPLMREDIYLG